MGRTDRNNPSKPKVSWTKPLAWLLPTDAMDGGEHIQKEMPERTCREAHSGEEGFAMMIALAALTALTVLGVAAITSASIDLRAAHNMRRWEQARYASIAGTEHARRNLVMNVMPALNEISYFDEADATPTYFIDESEAIVMESTAGEPLGTYTVEAIAVKCGGPPAGYSVEQFYSQFFDLRSKGILKDSNGKLRSPAASSTALTVRKVQPGKCYKR